MTPFQPITHHYPELGECVVLRYADGRQELGSREITEDGEGWLYCTERGSPKLADGVWKSDLPVEHVLWPTHFARLPKWEETQ